MSSIISSHDVEDKKQLADRHRELSKAKIRRLIGKDRSDEKEAKDGMSAEDAAYERKVKIGNTLRALFPILAFVLFGVLIMLLQGGRF